MKRVILVGGNTKAAEFDHATTAEIWGVNCQKLETIPQRTRMFNLHRYDLLKMYGYPCWRDAEWCKDHPDVTFYTADPWPDKRMATALVFPRYEIANSFRLCLNDYHCNSLDWLLAFAVHLGFEEIVIHGFTLARDGPVEQMSARACAEYWMGVAAGRGVKVLLAKDSDLCHPYHMVRSDRVYGYDDSPAWEDRSRDRRFDDVPYRYDDY